MFAGFRQTFEKAGPKALAALDAQFVPKVSTFDRATGFLLLDEQTTPACRTSCCASPRRSTQPRSSKAYLPDAEKTLHAGKTVYHGERLDLDLYFPDDRHIIVSPAGAMTHLPEARVAEDRAAVVRPQARRLGQAGGRVGQRRGAADSAAATSKDLPAEATAL